MSQGGNGQFFDLILSQMQKIPILSQTCKHPETLFLSQSGAYMVNDTLFQTNFFYFFTLSQIKLLKNPTFHSGTISICLIHVSTTTPPPPRESIMAMPLNNTIQCFKETLMKTSPPPPKKKKQIKNQYKVKHPW